MIKTKDGRLWEPATESERTSGASDFVVCFPQGGGFQYRIPRADVIDWDANYGEYRLLPVGFDGEPYVNGYVDDQRWNGWLCPFVDRENLLEFLKKQDALREQGLDTVTTGKLEGDVLHWCHNDDEHEPTRGTEEPVKIKVDGKQILVWGIGFGLVWEDCTPERFVWAWGNEPRVPEAIRGSSVLWDRQEGKAVITVHEPWGQLVCLETAKPLDGPFTQLAEWLNRLSNDDLASEGLTVTRDEGQANIQSQIYRGELEATDVDGIDTMGNHG